jgi:hypothetical protein
MKRGPYTGRAAIELTAKPFYLQLLAGFGFGPETGKHDPSEPVMRLAFCLDDLSRNAGVVLRQDVDGVVHGELQGAREPSAGKRARSGDRRARAPLPGSAASALPLAVRSRRLGDHLGPASGTPSDDHPPRHRGAPSGASSSSAASGSPHTRPPRKLLEIQP